MKSKLHAVLAIGIVGLSSCDKYDHFFPKPHDKPVEYPSVAEATNPKILATINGVNLYNGGFGSSMAQDPSDKSIFYLLTDRGPNVVGTIANSIVLATPDFHPQIGKFKLKGNRLTLESIIVLKNKHGIELNGLPNPAGAGATGETAYTINGSILPSSEEGVDSEGLTFAPDGSFWISDEYGPHIIHFDKAGRTIERINPFSSGSRKLPLVLARRRPNRGMEGLTITPDGKTLVGIMQFPLYNPSAAAIQGSLAIRILVFDIASGSSKQYVYLMENPNLQAVSEIVAINKNTFLVLERGSEFGTESNRQSIIKRIYKISLEGATNISDPANSASGKLFAGKTVEELKDAAGLAANGIVPVTKTLVVDLLKTIDPVYPHDKAEGLAIINSKMIAVCNDDDFGITGSNGVYQQKILPATNSVDANRIYFIRLDTPLY
ncbi:MAG: esterase-like activity of phytase family protein [Chitinophagaceae bacterium]|nr:esterase-like activity of phytase family protein [Chitinophagaceae bacterium]